MINQDGSGMNSVTLRLLEPERVTPPLAPASLVPLTGDWTVILELHRIIDGSGDAWTFATSDQRTPMPEPGSELGLQQWCGHLTPSSTSQIPPGAGRRHPSMTQPRISAVSAGRVVTWWILRLRTVVPLAS